MRVLWMMLSRNNTSVMTRARAEMARTLAMIAPGVPAREV
jgi:hypothetical protein